MNENSDWYQNEAKEERKNEERETEGVKEDMIEMTGGEKVEREREKKSMRK